MRRRTIADRKKRLKGLNPVAAIAQVGSLTFQTSNNETGEIDAQLAKVDLTTGSNPVKRSVSAHAAKVFRQNRKKLDTGRRPEGSTPLPMRTVMHPEQSGRIDPKRARATISALIRDRQKKANQVVD